MYPKKRVVVTGIGLVTPLGQTTETTWSKLVEGQSGIGQITLFDTETHPVKIAGEVQTFDPGRHITPKDL